MSPCSAAWALRITTLDKALVEAQSSIDTLRGSLRSQWFWRVAVCCWKSHDPGGVSRSMCHFSLDFTAAHSDVLDVDAVFALSEVSLWNCRNPWRLVYSPAAQPLKRELQPTTQWFQAFLCRLELHGEIVVGEKKKNTDSQTTAEKKTKINKWFRSKLWLRASKKV